MTYKDLKSNLDSVLLRCLDLHIRQIPEYRKAYIQDHAIVIYTRAGGEGRDFYDNLETCYENYPDLFDCITDPDGPWLDDLRQHPLYLFDADGAYDNSYCSFYFDFPERYRSDLLAFGRGETDHAYSKHWTRLILEG